MIGAHKDAGKSVLQPYDVSTNVMSNNYCKPLN